MVLNHLLLKCHQGNGSYSHASKKTARILVNVASLLLPNACSYSFKYHMIGVLAGLELDIVQMMMMMMR